MHVFKKNGKEYILNHLIATANETWNKKFVEEMQPALLRIVEAIWETEKFNLESEEEPANQTTIFNIVYKEESIIERL